MDFKQQLAKANKDSRHFAPPSSTATAFGAGADLLKVAGVLVKLGVCYV